MQITAIFFAILLPRLFLRSDRVGWHVDMSVRRQGAGTGRRAHDGQQLGQPLRRSKGCWRRRRRYPGGTLAVDDFCGNWMLGWQGLFHGPPHLRLSRSRLTRLPGTACNAEISLTNSLCDSRISRAVLSQLSPLGGRCLTLSGNDCGHLRV